jgi:hypothetical protein
MGPDSYRRHRGWYTFRAWIDEEGNNRDRHHAAHRPYIGDERGTRCLHLRLWDANTARHGHNIIRIVRRRRPFALGVYVGRRMRLRLQIGLPC